MPRKKTRTALENKVVGTLDSQSQRIDNQRSKERGKTHGEWVEQSKIEADLKLRLRTSANWNALSEGQKMALEAICVKMSRIVCGDPNHKDHWDDIVGYAKLVIRK